MVDIFLNSERNMKKFVQVALTIGVFLLCFNVAHADSPDMPVSQMQITTGLGNSPEITGFVTNNTGKLVKTAFIRFNLYDAQGTLIGNAADYIKDLAPGDRWKFETKSSVTDFSSYKLTGVDIYDN